MKILPQPVKNFAAFYGTRSCIASFTCQLPLSWARSIQFKHLILFLENSLSSHLRRGLPSFFFSLTFSHQHPVCTSPVAHSCHMLRSSHCFRGDFPNNIWWRLRTIRLLMVQYSSVPCYVVRLKPKCLPQHPILEHPKPVSSLAIRVQVSHSRP